MGSYACPGDKTEVIPCQANEPCASWGGWSEFSTCTVSCGGGTYTRTRLVNELLLDNNLHINYISKTSLTLFCT